MKILLMMGSQLRYLIVNFWLLSKIKKPSNKIRLPGMNDVLSQRFKLRFRRSNKLTKEEGAVDFSQDPCATSVCKNRCTGKLAEELLFCSQFVVDGFSKNSHGMVLGR